MTPASDAWRRLSTGHRHAALATGDLVAVLALPFHDEQPFALTADGRLVSSSGPAPDPGGGPARHSSV